MQETRVVLRNVGKIDPLKVEDYVAAGGYEGLKKALSMTQDDIIATVKASGLRGRGGAGFPTGLKWSFTKPVEAAQKYIVCNADEGEPATNKDRVILSGDPNSVFEGMAIAGLAIGATMGYIYLRAEYPYLFVSLNKALDNAKAKGYIGKNILGSGKDFDIKIVSGAGAYVCGEETALIESIEGSRGEPRFKPPYPGVEGLWKAPTIVNNVETLANVPQIIVNGGEWFAGIGSANSSGTRIFTLCGNIVNPGVYEFPTTITMRQLFEEVGGGCGDGKKLLAIQTGGASGPIITADDLDFEMSIDGCQKVGGGLGSGAMMFIDDSQCIIDVVENLMEFFVEESCGKCTPCREGNMRLLELVSKFKNGKGTMEDLDLIQELASTMMAASLCGLGQASPTPVVTSIANFRCVYERAALKGGK